MRPGGAPSGAGSIRPTRGVDRHTALPYSLTVLTIAETDEFRADVDSIWSQDERLEFCAWIAANPEAGDVIPGSGGCRKVRWAASGRGKRGGARVIYYNRLPDGVIWLLVIYTKAVRGSIPAHILKQIKETL